ncbi:MAG TPA: oxygen-independent coproporphyrinogen III oxidase, partial [Acholeplasmataceae bacterium]|nr:oxygen-independent coproporphyrinogen III oxidase [Acholeplasmataceae bacterium]
KKFELLDENKEYKIYKKITRFLKKYRYEHYEISNYALKNYQGKHNLVYWTNEKYLGIGAGASYYIDNVRYTNIMNLQQYFSGIDNKQLNYSEKTTLTEIDQMQEEMIMGLRKINGVDLSRFKEKYGIDIFDAFPVIKSLLQQKLLALKKNHIYIPKNRLYLSNRVLTEFL